MIKSNQENSNFRKMQIVGVIFISIALPAIYFLVYYTQGIKYSWSHTMYIPIILSGLLFGPWIGLICGVVGGVLLGPLMPIDVITGEPQLLINWTYRLLIFLIIGFISGYASRNLRNNVKTIKKLSSHNQETNIPNTNYLKYIREGIHQNQKTLATILVNNHSSIIDVLGERIYHKLLFALYQDLMNELPKNTIIIQADSNKIWIIKENENIEQDANKIVKIVNKARIIEGVPLYVEYAVGVSETFNHENFESLTAFTSSDICARQAQLKQINYIIYDNTKQKKRFEYELLMSFTQAIENAETYLMYQPKIDFKTMKPMGLEALMRWNSPNYGEIGPMVFIPLIEQTRLINELTNWVLINSIKKIKEFCDRGICTVISINISAKNLIDPQFFERTMKVIQESRVNKDFLEFEITESAVMMNPDENKAILDKFSKNGIKIAVDDFGTGYSSLSYLSRFPVNTIKIDKFFIKEISRNESIQRIVKSTIQLAKELGYKVLAEGIEEKEASDIVKEFGCDFAQGFYFAKPIKSEDVFSWYEDHLKNKKF